MRLMIGLPSGDEALEVWEEGGLSWDLILRGIAVPDLSAGSLLLPAGVVN